MTVYRVWRDSGGAIEVTADVAYIQEGCLRLVRIEQHTAGQDCMCERYIREDDGEPVDHRAHIDVVIYAEGYWRRVERVEDVERDARLGAVPR